MAGSAAGSSAKKRGHACRVAVRRSACRRPLTYTTCLTSKASSTCSTRRRLPRCHEAGRPPPPPSNLAGTSRPADVTPGAGLLHNWLPRHAGRAELVRAVRGPADERSGATARADSETVEAPRSCGLPPKAWALCLPHWSSELRNERLDMIRALVVHACAQRGTGAGWPSVR